VTRRALGTGPTTTMTTAAVRSGERLLPVERLAMVPDDPEAIGGGQQLPPDVPRPARRALGPRGAGAP
jgi:hypothetical protein